MKKKIVIVEDDYIIQELHKLYVNNLGHDVVACFEKGADAIEYFKENYADLILMDIRLEDSLDGIETMRKIQEIRPIPVVYITGNTEDSNYRRAINTNMKGFLSKPVLPDELEKIIDSLNDLTESIIYAERIQKAIFPQRKDLYRIFKSSMYINRPKNILSGDFCFLLPRKKNADIIGGIGDCTGHGVPAALLSVLSHEILTNTIKKNKDLKNIIVNLNSSIIRNFTSKNKEQRISDSLDLVIFKIIPKDCIIEISGIKRPFIQYDSISKKHVYHNLKGESIGTTAMIPDDVPFESIKYAQHDAFYFFSDGITDQFGGPNSKKLMKKGLLDFLDRNISKTLLEKEIELEIFLRKWQNKTEQTDDMIFIGISPFDINSKYIAQNN